MPEKKIDWVKPVLIAGGVGLTGYGVWWFLSHRELGIKPGGTVRAVFKFSFTGTPADYVLQVSFGTQGIKFDHVEGLTFKGYITLPNVVTGNFIYSVDCLLPMATEKKAYDAEALIQHQGAGLTEYILKAVTKKAIKVV